MSTVSSAAKTILVVAGIWLLVAAFAALEFGPLVPRSRVGLIGLLVFGPPLYLLGEFFSTWLWSTKTARAISEHPSRTARIFGGVAFGAVVIALCLAVTLVFNGR